MAKATTQALVEVCLSGRHTHAGREREAGETIHVTPRQKLFLEESGKIAAVIAKDQRVEETDNGNS